MTYAELHRQVASFAAGLRAMGVEKGDPCRFTDAQCAGNRGGLSGNGLDRCHMVGVLARVRNAKRHRAVPPDRAEVLVAVDGYRYRGRDFDKREAVRELERNLPTLEATVVLPYLSDSPDLSALSWPVLWTTCRSIPTSSSSRPFRSIIPCGSCTPRVPLVSPSYRAWTRHVLLEHLKTLTFHMDLGENDKFFWYTTTGWMMWNFLIGGLLIDATVQLYDGDPSYPDLNRLWSFAHDTGTTYFGTSAPFIHGCLKRASDRTKRRLSAIRGVGSTGAPLSPEGFVWVYENVNDDLLLGSFSGGTDVCTGFVGPSPLLPVHAGEIQCSAWARRWRHSTRTATPSPTRWASWC